MFEPVKHAFGRFMGDFYASLVPTTKPMQEFCARGLEKSIGIAPGKMVDAAESMVNSWIKNVQESENGSTRGPSKNHQFPAIIVAFAKDSPAYEREYGRPMSDAEFVQIPDDPLKRIFKLRTIGLDMRVQIVVISHDEPSARSIAAQFQAFVDQGDKRRFKAVYEFAQTETLWPCQIENTSVPFLNIPSEADNLTLLASDLTLHCTVPLFEASPVGKGITPYGFPAVREVRYDGFHEREHVRHSIVGEKLVP